MGYVVLDTTTFSIGFCLEEREFQLHDTFEVSQLLLQAPDPLHSSPDNQYFQAMGHAQMHVG